MADILLCVSPFFDGGTQESHALLRTAAERYAGARLDWTLDYGPTGKPTFRNVSGIHFSITHSGAYWMCAFSRENLGLDLQIHQACHREKLSRQFFHPAEADFLRRRDQVDFFDLWAAKESYLKYTGVGITKGFDFFSVVSPDDCFPAMEGLWLRLLPWEAGYSLCLCARHPAEVTVMRL